MPAGRSSTTNPLNGRPVAASTSVPSMEPAVNACTNQRMSQSIGCLSESRHSEPGRGLSGESAGSRDRTRFSNEPCRRIHPCPEEEAVTRQIACMGSLQLGYRAFRGDYASASTLHLQFHKGRQSHEERQHDQGGRGNSINELDIKTLSCPQIGERDFAQGPERNTENEDHRQKRKCDSTSCVVQPDGDRQECQRREKLVRGTEECPEFCVHALVGSTHH